MNYQEDPVPYITKKGFGTGYVYLIKCGKFYKIGWTSYHPNNRLNSIKTDNPNKVIGVHSIKVSHPLSVEKEMHARFQEYRHRGEWFKLPKEIVTNVVETMNAYV